MRKNFYVREKLETQLVATSDNAIFRQWIVTGSSSSIHGWPLREVVGFSSEQPFKTK